jgi:tRNA-specific 2-thiouridylase
LFIQNTDIHYIRPDLILNDGDTATYEVRIRYRQPLQKAMLHKKPNGLYIEFESPQKGITPGQFAAWYSNGELIGSGAIN